MINLQPSTCPLPRARSLPKNISLLKGGYNVRVGRAGVVYRAWVPGSYRPPSSPSPGGEGRGEGGPLSTDAALARAIALRDRFLRIHGEVNRHRVQGKSNTGLAGISETTKWKRNHSYPGFSVDWCERGRHRNRHFRYAPGFCTREQAAAQARSFRARVANLNLSTFNL